MLPTATLLGLIDALAPLLAVYMSARIINELTVASQLDGIYALVALTVILTFAFSFARSLLERRMSVLASAFALDYLLLLGERNLAIEFAKADDSQVSASLADIRAKTWGNDLGIVSLVPVNYQVIVQRLCSVFASALLLRGMLSGAEVMRTSFITSNLATGGIVLLVLANIALNLRQNAAVLAVMRESHDINPKVNTMLNYYSHYAKPDAAAKDLRIYNQEPLLHRVYANNGVDFWHRFFHQYGLLLGNSGLNSAVTSVAVYLLIGLRALAGMYSLGNVVQYVGAITALIGGLSTLVNQVITLRNNAEYLPQAFDFLDLPHRPQGIAKAASDGKDGETAMQNDLSNHGSGSSRVYEVEFHEVSFKYPGSSEYALKNLSLKFRIGQRLAVVGENGSGKTTMIKLLCRFYEPSEGYITLNGIDIREYAYDEYLSIFAVVFQDFQLLGVTVGENVSSQRDYDVARVSEALQMAGFSERLAEMEQGLQTVLLKSLDKEGINISGGEAQKIALARALYKEAPFIILDEPTAALDPIAEYDIYTRINEIVGGKTAVYISHRLSSCRFCDDIAVFHHGELVQRGSHEALLADAAGKYAELWQAQAQHYVS